MACTTILVGKKASNDGSTMIARNDDGHFDVKKIVVVEPKDQPKVYKSKISHLQIELPENPMRYTACPSVQGDKGIWAAMGINAANVGMTATETITTNARVMGADPYVEYKKGRTAKEDKAGGIGEEDLVVITLPYIKSAREGVLRLGSLLEKYGTYEPNGIAFNDKDEVWWLESIGGHHWIARKVKDDEYVIMPNQFGLDRFDLKDALGEGKKNLCSKDLKEFIEKNHLDQNNDGKFNPRLIFGSHADSDHVYNTPRAWFMGRYFNPRTYKWDGENADFTPESDDIPWSLVPERKIAVEEVKYILSSYYQGTDYNPYGRGQDPKHGMYRPIGISRTGCMAVLQIRPDVPEEIRGVEWICFGSNAFNTMIPVYTNVPKMPRYLSSVTKDASTDNFYWSSRLIGALADAHIASSMIYVERYQKASANHGRQVISEYDQKMIESKNFSLAAEANEKACAIIKRDTQDALNKILLDCSEHMRNGYHRFDN